MPHGPDDDLTIAPTPVATPPPRSPASVRLTPGAIVGGRYRLVALLGRGGMGDVYRADDLTLDQPVALKFLPASVAADPARLAQFHQELRIARQVSHKNVCRLYDLGEADGRRFITMEYVDGEDLASLLRRIGRLPQDKAIETARQLCAGLAAAHERGVLHRDLKPANVMLDGDGHVRIADFGLAVPDTDVSDTGAIAGTPQYMAPEQLAGQPASVKSDLYALGLVLFEIFTGRRAYDARTLNDLRQFHQSGTLTTPSSVVRDLDPAIERVILRCLERDPGHRPASALAVAAALPGGDPIAAALAAGETPSPEMLAKAGEIEAVPAGRALTATLMFLMSLAAFTAYAPFASLPGLVPLDKPADVLIDRAEQMLASFGYADAAADRASGFASVANGYPDWIAARHPAPQWWNEFRAGSPSALELWYRTSPIDLVPDNGRAVSPTDPPPTVPGMRKVNLDMRGRLLEFYAVPPEHDRIAASPPPDWKIFFDAAGQNMAAFKPVPPEWTPRVFADARAAWEGPLADRPDITVRIETAAYHGHPVSFVMLGPWTRESRTAAVHRSLLEMISNTFATLVWTLAIAGAALIARHNLNAERADRRAAARLSIGLMIARTIGWIAVAHHVATPSTEISQFNGAMTGIVFEGATVWVVYLALEPYARRFWPDSLLGWTRFFSGRIRDPRVGRDLLIGLLFGSLNLLMEAVHAWVAQTLNTPLQPPFGIALSVLSSAPRVLNAWAVWGHEALISTLFICLLFIVLRLVMPRPWMAAVVGLAIITAISNNGTAVSGGWVEIIFVFSVVALATAVLFRYGLLALAIGLFVDDVVTGVPLSPHLAAWWAGASTLTLLAFAAIAIFAFYASRAAQPLFGDILTRG